MSTHDLRTLALALPPEERLALANDLWDSLRDEPPLSHEEWVAAWAPELERRAAEAESGEVDLIDWREAIAKMRQSLDQEHGQ